MALSVLSPFLNPNCVEGITLVIVFFLNNYPILLISNKITDKVNLLSNSSMEFVAINDEGFVVTCVKTFLILFKFVIFY